MTLRSRPTKGMYHPELVSAPTLPGRWAALVRVTWVAVAAVSLVLLVVSLVAYYQQALALSAPALRDRDVHDMGDPETLRASLRQLGLSVDFYAAYTTIIFVLYGLAYTAVGLMIFLRRPTEGMALFVSLWLVVFGAAFSPTAWSLEAVSPTVYALHEALGNIAYLSFFLLFYVFPDGRFVPRWTRRAAARH